MLALAKPGGITYTSLASLVSEAQPPYPNPGPCAQVCALDASHDWFLSMREGLSWNVRKQQGGKGQ